MDKQQLGGQIEDPYRYLAIAMIRETFRTIKCYYSNKGTREELLDGKYSLRWIKKMGPLFEACAIACGKPVDIFHQMCIWKINCIKEEVRHERAVMAGQD